MTRNWWQIDQPTGISVNYGPEDRPKCIDYAVVVEKEREGVTNIAQRLTIVVEVVNLFIRIECLGEVTTLMQNPIFK